jgi:hypothetical protein
MISKSTEDLIESYTEDIKKKLPLRYVICLFLGIILYWGAENGLYESAILSTLTLNPNNAISSDKSLLDIPNYIYLTVFASMYFLFETIKWFTQKYLIYIAKIPAIREPLEEILNPSETNGIDSNEKIDPASIEVMMNDFYMLREKVEKNASNSQAIIVGGIFVIGSAYFGNILDFSIGFIFIFFGILRLHKSCKIFIQDLLPKRLEIRRIFLYLNDQKLQKIKTDDNHRIV